ncbi:hypothetical protein NW754_007851 [Fusarium falciforme]|nr:hypothetical protein NW754_007851 [Fusarium falciforme]
MGLIQPYANNHHNPSRPGDGRPTAIQIVEDQQLIGKWAGRVALRSEDAAQTFLEKSQSLHVLVNNAGVLGCLKQITGEGVDTHFATNYLGHFLLFQLLKASLLASTRDFEVHVVNVASVAHRLGTYDLEDLTFENRAYEASTAYGASKLATVHFANEIERRYGA